MGRPFPPSRRLLLAEDDRDLRDVLFEVLKSCGASVVAVADGRAAIDRIREDDSFDLAILDVHMPRMTGLEVLRESRRIGRSLPIVLISSSVDDETRAQARALGAMKVVDKPFDPDELRQILLDTARRPVGQRVDWRR